MGSASDTRWIGTRLDGRYDILNVIGQGGMGVVYRAKQVSVDREVAIKMMRSRGSSYSVERLRAEVKACSRLTHPNTIRLYDSGITDQGNFYMVMELLRGRSLEVMIKREQNISVSRILRIVIQCCASLSEAHRLGIIHRDIKPGNIFVGELAGQEDFIKLFDFSIAKDGDNVMTQAGIIIGTPQYMSPQQARGLELDGRSDLYSLGVIAYRMLAGKLPFTHTDPIKILKMHCKSQVPALPATIPTAVVSLVMSCLAKNPDQRPATALDLLESAKLCLLALSPALDINADPVLQQTLINLGSPPPLSSSSLSVQTGALTAPLTDEIPTNRVRQPPAVAARTLGGQQKYAPLASQPTESTPPRPQGFAPPQQPIPGNAPGPQQADPAPLLLSPPMPVPANHQPSPSHGSNFGYFLLCLVVAAVFGAAGYYVTVTLQQSGASPETESGP